MAKEGRGRSNFDNCIRLPCSYPFLRFLFRYKESGFERRGEFTMQPETGFDPLKWLAPCQHRNTSATNVSLSLPFVSLTAIPVRRPVNPHCGIARLPSPPVNTSFLSLDEARWVDDLDGVASNWSRFKIALRYRPGRRMRACIDRVEPRVSGFEFICSQEKGKSIKFKIWSSRWINGIFFFFLLQKYFNAR